MAGDWIKMRIDLQSHPKVVRILSAMRPHDVQTITDKFRVIGGLHAVWSVFDTHSIDGVLYGYTPETLDHIIGWEGFSAAMQHVEWLCFDGKETLTLPEFTEHNGQSAKRRAEDQKRKKDSRQSVRNLSADNADKKRTREEKRREEKKEQEQEHTRGTRLPADWKPSEAETEWATQERPSIDVQLEAAKFADYWHGVAGAKGVKLDWPGTWRNWIRRADAPRNGAPPTVGTPRKRRELGT